MLSLAYVLGCDVGPSEAEACWAGFLRDLVARGLTGVPLVISDAHSGLVAALIRTIFVQPDHAVAVTALARVAEALHPRFWRVADELRDMAAELSALLHFSPPHWRQIYSTNPPGSG